MISSADALAALVSTSGLDASGDRGTGSVAATDVEYRFDPQRTTELLADALHELHELEPGVAADQLSPLTMSDVVSEAGRRIRIDPPPVLDAAYRHLSHERLLQVLTDGAATLGDSGRDPAVLTHGRPDLVSLRCRDGVAVGFCEWSGAAVADRHRDLAHGASAVAASLGPMLVPVFFERYGRRPDPVRLDWWALALQLTDSAVRGLPE